MANDHQRPRYLEHIECKLDELRAKFENLQIQIEVALVKGDRGMEGQLVRARAMVSEYMATLETSFDRLRDAPDEAWEELRYALDQAWDDVSEASKRLVLRLVQTCGADGSDTRF